MEWDKVYSLPFRSTLESKTREFQYKILNCDVYTNEKLYRFSLVASPNCTFLSGKAESFVHLPLSSKISSEFWKHFLSLLKDNDIYIETLKAWDIIFGKSDIKDNFNSINIYYYQENIIFILKSVRIVYRQLRASFLGLN